LFSKHSVNIKIAVLLIYIGFNVKSGPGSRETKQCASIADLDPDPGQTLPLGTKVEILHGKIYFMKVTALGHKAYRTIPM